MALVAVVALVAACTNRVAPPSQIASNTWAPSGLDSFAIAGG